MLIWIQNLGSIVSNVTETMSRWFYLVGVVMATLSHVWKLVGIVLETVSHQLNLVGVNCCGNCVTSVGSDEQWQPHPQQQSISHA